MGSSRKSWDALPELCLLPRPAQTPHAHRKTLLDTNLPLLMLWEEIFLGMRASYLPRQYKS